MMIPKIVLEPITELLTLDQCRLQCKVDPESYTSDGAGVHTDDALIMAFQTAAREYCESFLGLSLVPRAYEIALDEFPITDDGAVELPMGPVTAIVSVTVGTGVGSVMASADYVLDDFSVPNRLLPVTAWPTVSALNTIRIVYTAGYEAVLSDGQPVPNTIVQAIRLILADWYKHREDTDVNDVQIPNGAMSLLRVHRILQGMA